MYTQSYYPFPESLPFTSDHMQVDQFPYYEQTTDHCPLTSSSSSSRSSSPFLPNDPKESLHYKLQQYYYNDILINLQKQQNLVIQQQQQQQQNNTYSIIHPRPTKPLTFDTQGSSLPPRPKKSTSSHQSQHFLGTQSTHRANPHIPTNVARAQQYNHNNNNTTTNYHTNQQSYQTHYIPQPPATPATSVVQHAPVYKRQGAHGLGKGQFGAIYKVQSSSSHNFYAEKQFFTFTCDHMPSDKYGVHHTDIMDLLVLRSIHHPNVMHAHNVIASIHFDNKTKQNTKTISAIMPLGDCDLRKWVLSNPVYGFLSKYQNESHKIQAEINIRFQIAKQLIQGVHAIHQAGVLHMDIKPSNVIVFPRNNDTNNTNTRAPLIRITDFGISELINGIKDTNYEKVTWAYRAPELFGNSIHYDKPVDVWSIGVILCFLFFDHELLKYQYEHINEQTAMFHMSQICLGFIPHDWMSQYCRFPAARKKYTNFTHSNLNINSTTYRQPTAFQFFEKLIPDAKKRIIYQTTYGSFMVEQMCELILTFLHLYPEKRVTLDSVLDNHPLFSQCRSSAPQKHGVVSTPHCGGITQAATTQCGLLTSTAAQHVSSLSTSVPAIILKSSPTCMYYELDITLKAQIMKFQSHHLIVFIQNIIQQLEMTRDTYIAKQCVACIIGIKLFNCCQHNLPLTCSIYNVIWKHAKIILPSFHSLERHIILHELFS